MNLFKAYALCINTGKIKLPNDKTLDKFKCDIFTTLEEANLERIKRNPLDFQIIEVYGNKSFFNPQFKMHLTYNSNE
jgi:hypothetical protein